MPELIPAVPGCDCFAFETCPLCYSPPELPAAPSGDTKPKNIWDLPIFGWAWTEDGRDRRA